MNAAYYNGEPGALPSERWLRRLHTEHEAPVSCVDCGLPVHEGGQTLWARRGAACAVCVEWRREHGVLDDARSIEQLRKAVA